jgi:hypothetical protein
VHLKCRYGCPCRKSLLKFRFVPTSMQNFELSGSCSSPMEFANVTEIASCHLLVVSTRGPSATGATVHGSGWSAISSGRWYGPSATVRRASQHARDEPSTSTGTTCNAATTATTGTAIITRFGDAVWGAATAHNVHAPTSPGAATATFVSAAAAASYPATSWFRQSCTATSIFLSCTYTACGMGWGEIRRCSFRLHLLSFLLSRVQEFGIGKIELAE